MEELRVQFIRSAIWNGNLDEANALLQDHPYLASCDIHTAAITGNAEAVQKFLKEDPDNVGKPSAPYGGNALVYLCLSKYLRFDQSKHEDFIKAATALLDAGADPNSNFRYEGYMPDTETALYGAAGVAHDAALTRLLLQRGADPNDGETTYHSPETYDNEAMFALVETGKLTKDSLSVMLIRKLDFHDFDGAKYLLDRGADPDGASKQGWFTLQHSLSRCNALAFIDLLLEYRANPYLVRNGFNAISFAAREGRNDVLKLFAEKGIKIELEGADRLIAACASGDHSKIEEIIVQNPDLKTEVQKIGGTLLARFCIAGNTNGVRNLLHLGIDVNTPYATGFGYFEIPPNSLPIHIAAWLGRDTTVELLIKSGATIDAADKNGRTPLALAIKACVDSYWTERRSPLSVKALLNAGVSLQNISFFPTGYDEIDQLLAAANNQSLT